MTLVPIDLANTPDYQAFEQAAARAAQQTQPPGRRQFIVTYYDKWGYPLGECGDYISVTFTPKRNAIAPATIVVKDSDPFVDVAFTARKVVVPVTIELESGWRWSGRCDVPTDDYVAGVATTTIQLIGDYCWFSSLLVFPAWWMPIEAQIPKEAVFIGPAVTNIKEMISEQILRQSGLLGALLEFAGNILNPAAYIGSLLDVEELALPLVVVPTNPLTDTSKWTAITCKMTTVAAAVEQTLKDCGLLLTADFWRVGDPQPPSLAAWGIVLTKPTIVIDVRDYSTVTGLTGTALDGLIGEAVSLIDTVLGEILTLIGGADIADSGSTNATNPYGDGILAQLLGLEAKPSWVIYEDGPRSGIQESHIAAHAPLAYRVVTGGKSPDWVNKGIDLLLEWALSELLAAFGASGISSTLLDGILDNVFLAYMQIEDEKRRIDLGPFGRPEYFAQGGSAAYTLDALVILESALWDTRGYYSFQLVAMDGYPYTFGGDLFGVQYGDFGIGFPVSWIRKGVIYTDYCTEATITDDRTHRVQIMAKIGDQSALESPWARMARRIGSLFDIVKAASLAQN
ncbi:Gp37-like protein [Nocardia nova]